MFNMVETSEMMTAAFARASSVCHRVAAWSSAGFGIGRWRTPSKKRGTPPSIPGFSPGMRRRAFMYFRCLVCISCLSFSSLGLANSYTLGKLKCKDFKESETYLKHNPESVIGQFGYATCLVIKGETDEGLRKLQHLVDTKHHVWSAYFIARYFETAGKFEPANIAEIDIISAIKAYSYVLYLIDLDTDYPKGYEIAEGDLQMELYSTADLTSLYLDKFLKGFISDYMTYIEVSPSYEGYKGLNSFPEYSPYILDSLNQTIQKADNCLNLPKKRHFHPGLYKNVKKGCQIYKEGAKAIILLEQERQRLLTQESCRIDVLKCEEFLQVLDEIRSLYDKIKDDVRGSYIT